MRFSIASVLALATAAFAQREPTPGFNVITKPTEGEQVSAGSTYEIVWQPDSTHPGDITIGLLGGSAPNTLAVIDTIATGVDATTGSYSWEVPVTLGDLATYGIMITLESDKDIFQYGFPFEIVGGSGGDDDDSTSTTGTVTGTKSATATTTGSTTTGTSDSTRTSFTVSSSTITSSTLRGNLSTTASQGQQTTITTVVTDNQPTTTALTTSIATDAAASFAAGSIAMLGGVAMAVLAL